MAAGVLWGSGNGIPQLCRNALESKSLSQFVSLDAAAFLLPFLLLLAAQTGAGVAEEVVGFLLINLSHPGQFGHERADEDMSSRSQLSRLEGQIDV